MKYLLLPVVTVVFTLVSVGFWLAWQLLRQNGRILLRLDEVEKRLDELEFAEPDDEPPGSRRTKAPSEIQTEQGMLISAATAPGVGRETRFRNHSLVRSKIKRDGLKAGTAAPDFKLPCLDGSECSLRDFRGRRVLLVFSDPHCGPCQALAPTLETFHRQHPEISLVMISRGEPGENRAKVKDHGLSFLVVLQQRWEISRRYAMFATPAAYLIDESGVVAHDVAMGVDQVQALFPIAAQGADGRPEATFALNSAAKT